MSSNPLTPFSFTFSTSAKFSEVWQALWCSGLQWAEYKRPSEPLRGEDENGKSYIKYKRQNTRQVNDSEEAVLTEIDSQDGRTTILVEGGSRLGNPDRAQARFISQLRTALFLFAEVDRNDLRIETGETPKATHQSGISNSLRRKLGAALVRASKHENFVS
jgi:hypothetical protein